MMIPGLCLVGYDDTRMVLRGKFSYDKSNQRTLSFNVDLKVSINVVFENTDRNIRKTEYWNVSLYSNIPVDML